MADEPERKKKCREERKKKLEQRRNKPKHNFNDSSYMDQIRSTEESMDSALQRGMQAATSTKGTKRKLHEGPSNSVAKKPRIW